MIVEGCPECAKFTGGCAAHAMTVTLYGSVPMLQVGWQCPVCHRVYAPWVTECVGHGRSTDAGGA